MLKEFVFPHIANIKTFPVNRDFEYLEISQISLTNVEYQTATVAQGEEPDRAHYILQKGDVVVSTVRPNRNAVALIEEDDVIGSSGLSVLRPRATVLRDKIESEYLFAFCKTRYFVNCLMRANKASMYPAVSNADVLSTPFFDTSGLFMSQIARTVRNSISQLSDAKTQRAEAETLLLSEIGLADWHPKQKLAFRHNYSDFQRAKRIDADYFQPKYDEIVDAVKAYPSGWDALGNLAHIRSSNFKPAVETEYRYIELADIGRNGEIIGHTKDHGHNLPIRARCKVAAGDVIVSSVEGSLDSVALISEEYDNALCSTGFYAVSSNAINSETLLTLLKSCVGQMQLKKGCSGTILTAINSVEFKKLALPLILPDKQREIEQKVAESFLLRERSKELLEYAKRAVEIAIEQDEQTAIDWLRQKTEGGA